VTCLHGTITRTVSRWRGGSRSRQRKWARQSQAELETGNKDRAESQLSSEKQEEIQGDKPPSSWTLVCQRQDERWTVSLSWNL